MALIGKIKKIPASETEPQKEIFEVEFTNGTVAQLKELAEFLKTQGITIPVEDDKKLEEVVRLGVAYLQRSKELASNNQK